MHNQLDNIGESVTKLASLIPELRQRFAAVEELEKQLDLLFPDETQQREVVREALTSAWYELLRVARSMTFEDTNILNVGLDAVNHYKEPEAAPDAFVLQGQAGQLSTPRAKPEVRRKRSAAALIKEEEQHAKRDARERAKVHDLEGKLYTQREALDRAHAGAMKAETGDKAQPFLDRGERLSAKIEALENQVEAIKVMRRARDGT